MSSCKAAYYNKDQYSPTEENIRFNKNKTVELYFFIPLIIIDGYLIEVYLEKEKIIISEETWIPIIYEYVSKNYSNSSGGTTFLPTIISLAGLNDYLKILDEWRCNMEKGFLESLRKLRDDK